MSRTRGHRLRAHTADMTLEAWGESRAECAAEAVLALADMFVDAHGAAPSAWLDVAVAAHDDADALVGLLEEVIYAVDVSGQVPVRAVLDDHGTGLGGRLGMVPLDRVESVGAAPKGVSRHALRFGPEGDGWSCTVTVDV